jgi:dipeptidyl aminopeptidase/acylaminoacyl peptidase
LPRGKAEGLPVRSVANTNNLTETPALSKVDLSSLQQTLLQSFFMAHHRCPRALLFICSACLIVSNCGQTNYQKARPEIRAILDAPLPPRPILSPNGAYAILGRGRVYPPISDLAEPMLPLAGIRINPKNNSLHDFGYAYELAIKKLPDGPETPVSLPPGARINGVRWNVTETHVNFLNITATAAELWVMDVNSAKARLVPGVKINPLLGSPVSWMPDQKSLLVKIVPPNRGPLPTADIIPTGPYVDETGSGTVASSTYESRDLLKTPQDADAFEYYTTSQLALADIDSGKITHIGSPAVYDSVTPSPDGRYLLVEQFKRPYSYLRAYERFPYSATVWDITGKLIETIADLPLAEQVPIHGVRTGPRFIHWQPTAPATLVWVEALDGGDTYKKVPHHDRLMVKTVNNVSRELLKTKHRLSGVEWIEGGGVLIEESDRDAHRTTTDLIYPDKPSIPARRVWDRSTDDSYGDPGALDYRVLPNGQWVVRLHEGAIFLGGIGATPRGNRPFLDRLNLSDLKTERLFRSGTNELESFIGWIDPGKGTFLTSRESRSEPPNLFLRTLKGRLPGASEAGESTWESNANAITHFSDPTPQLRKISKQLVTYQRADGVALSFTLYLPPDYKEGTRLPTVLWAYPLDYTDPSGAGQVRASANNFTRLVGASPLFLALAGYAVLDETAMPIVGPTETAYDTFVEQITDNAKAAIQKAAELGVCDTNRVGVFGHSHGALMTANLLIWTDLFRAGVARSGAYNHTLRPFGFQNERRTLYKARQTYFKLSPLMQADQINEPLLLIHGERDANPGTVPLQSQKLYEAIRGVGGASRLVLLPFESHGYRARESVEHVLHETIAWFDRFVRDAATLPNTQQ